LTLVEDEIRLPTGATISYLRQAPGAGDAVTVVALDDTERVLVQREYSYPPDEIMWQLPGGPVEPEEDIFAAAERELRAESGVSADVVERVGSFYLDNRRSDGRVHVVQCTGLHLDRPDPTDTEFVENHWFTVIEVHDLISNGEIGNVAMLGALNLWFHMV
jgi:ADP-ribose pyrophosphatase